MAMTREHVATEVLHKEGMLPYEEEMSGMFTLKRKKEKGGGEEISRSLSVLSRSSSSSGGHCRRSQFIDPAANSRTSRSSGQNHY